MPAEILYYLATGALAGFAAGLLGVGGGLIIVPVLYTVFGYLGFDSAHLMHLAHHRKRAVLWPVFTLLAPGILVGAWLGGMIAARLDTTILKPVFGVFELFVAIHLLRRAVPVLHRYSIGRIKAFFGGNVIGGVSAIVGIGGGTLTVPFLAWHNVAMRNAVATSAACGLPIAIAGTASYIVTGIGVTGLPDHAVGYVYLPAFALIVLTSFLFAPLGARAAHALPEPMLKTGFGLFLLAVSAKMLLF